MEIALLGLLGIAAMVAVHYCLKGPDKEDERKKYDEDYSWEISLNRASYMGGSPKYPAQKEDVEDEQEE